MRIIAGKLRSRRLKGPGNLKLRPTSDRLRETLFNVIGPSIAGSIFVDLFAGTGAVGIEALSRGAHYVVFVENHPKAIRLIQDNLESLGISNGVEILGMDAERAIDALAARGVRADFVFLDPPYAAESSRLCVLEAISGVGLVRSEGFIIMEFSKRMPLDWNQSHFQMTRLLLQGDSGLIFWRRLTD